MIRTFALTHKGETLLNVPLPELNRADIAWYWVDFSQPTDAEGALLDTHFQFHPLAIEDCFHFLQRSKLDHYEGYDFFVIHALNQKTLESDEVDLFLGKNYLVSFHVNPLREIDQVWASVQQERKHHKKGVSYLTYRIIDKLVDNYFPALYQIEDQLDEIEDNTEGNSIGNLMDQVFDIRSDLLRIRRTVVPMRDLIYRILSTEQTALVREHRAYVTDIQDHLIKLAEMIDSNREMTSDMRDSYLSVNQNRMNQVMMTLTVITTIFMPLTLIAGIYGMNFDNMPELHWHNGYFLILAVMGVTGVAMYWVFKRKGWFD
ncbi:MAG TPA: magnesium/cobalt transporter CorA [Bacilli bacterium]|nr:magnesium/cobalt transporter CorA [Bacilli bacterium]